MKRAVYKDGKFKIPYADHFTMILYMKKKLIRWNLKKEGG